MKRNGCICNLRLKKKKKKEEEKRKKKKWQTRSTRFRRKINGYGGKHGAKRPRAKYYRQKYRNMIDDAFSCCLENIAALRENYYWKIHGVLFLDSVGGSTLLRETTDVYYVRLLWNKRTKSDWSPWYTSWTKYTRSDVVNCINLRTVYFRPCLFSWTAFLRSEKFPQRVYRNVFICISDLFQDLLPNFIKNTSLCIFVRATMCFRKISKKNFKSVR